MKLPPIDVMQIWRNGSPTLTVQLRRKREFAVRLWLAKMLIWLACWILEMGVQFEDIEDTYDKTD